MALYALDRNRCGNRTSSSNLDRVTQLIGIGGLSNDTGINRFALFNKPIKNGGRSVDRWSFFITGDQKRNRSLKIAFT